MAQSGPGPVRNAAGARPTRQSKEDPMAAVIKTAEVDWTASMARGAGLVSGGSRAITNLPFTLASRDRSAQGRDEPRRLYAAAHPGCITLATGSILVRQGTHRGRLHVSAIVPLEVYGRPTIAPSQLDVHGPGHRCGRGLNRSGGP
jgi:osmotically inducible protein OsmC